MIDFIDKNKSYTNKDANAIYNELLDLVPKLTTKWNPAESNEADPGVVLIKLMAVLGDKLNYNMDKQVLEMFPGTVTQRRNARQLYDLIGYHMGWYRSSIVDVSFQIRNEKPNSLITIPKFTQLTDIDSKVSFVTLNEVQLNPASSTRGNIVTTEAMEGVLKDLTIDGSILIQINDLDEDLRIYFNATNIAENGIFIADANSNIYDWQQVTNIDSYSLGQKIFEFRVTEDESVAYIQFPRDLNALISYTDALNIKYITTSGLAGNINANILEMFVEPLLDENGVAQEENIRITQGMPAVNGTDLESIEDAYKNSRLIIGTFNTLVTRLDYQNYIRRLMNGNKHLVSNAVVADRTTDINYSNKIMVIEDFRNKLIMTYKGSGNSELTAYEIVLYLLHDSSDYDEAFEVIDSAEVLFEIEKLTDEVKAINQDFRLPSNDAGDILYIVKNKYKLKGQLVTTERLSEEEAQRLEEKVKIALLQKYSANNVQFGKGIDYSELINFILSVDNRIKTIALDNPMYQAYLVRNDGVLKEATLTQIQKQELVARMILAGNIQLFKFDNLFKKDFGQIETNQQANLNFNIKKIKTEVTIDLDSDDLSPYTLKQNEVVQLVTPLYRDVAQYSSGVKATFKSNVVPKTLEIPANTAYFLKTGESIFLEYTDENGVNQTPSLTNVIINCSVGLKEDIRTPLVNNGILSVKEKSVATLRENTKVFPILNTNRVWNDTLKLYQFTLNVGQTKILDTDEFFVYTNSQNTELIFLGSGTSLQNTGLEDIVLNLTEPNLADLNAENIQKIQWINLPSRIESIENEIITLNEGSTLKLSSDVSGDLSLNNDFKYMTTNKDENGTPLKLVVRDESGEHTITKSDGGEPYQIKSRFNLIFTDSDIKIDENQSVEFFQSWDSISGITLNTPDVYIQFSKPVLISGSNSILIDEDDLKVFTYEKDSTYTPRDSNLLTFSESRTVKFNFTELTDNVSGEDFNDDGEGTLYLIPMKVVSNEVSPITSITTKFNNTDVAVYPMNDYQIDAFDDYVQGNYILCVKPDCKDLEFTLPAGNKTTISLGYIKSIVGINLSEINTVDVEDIYNTDIFSLTFNDDQDNLKNIFYQINTLNKHLTDLNFDYTYIVPDADKIIHPTLSDSFFNRNHIANNYTIPMLDLKKYNIKVNQFSKK